MLDYLSDKVQDSPRTSFIDVGDDGASMSRRGGDWKATYLESRVKLLQVWRGPLVKLRMPVLFNRRRDPLEKSYKNSNTYHDWMIDRVFVLGPMQAVAIEFLKMMVEFPPSQKAGDWSLESLQKQIESMNTSGK
jgi:arylsulfatase